MKPYNQSYKVTKMSILTSGHQNELARLDKVNPDRFAGEYTASDTEAGTTSAVIECSERSDLITPVTGKVIRGIIFLLEKDASDSPEDGGSAGNFAAKREAGRVVIRADVERAERCDHNLGKRCLAGRRQVELRDGRARRHGHRRSS